MISNPDRSGWFGASDIKFIVGSYNSKTFKKWWMQKLGIIDFNFTNSAMKAGTFYEHKILDSIVPYALKDSQILIPELHLRVNLDGDTDDCIYEVKTYNFKNGFKVPKYYNQQVQVQMFAKQCYNAKIIAYGLLEKDYSNYFNDIDIKRISMYNIEYDIDFISNSFLPRIKYLSKCLDLKIMPKNEEINL